MAALGLWEANLRDGRCGGFWNGAVSWVHETEQQSCTVSYNNLTLELTSCISSGAER